MSTADVPNVSEQVASLAINDGPGVPDAFASFYEPEPPPTPQLHSHGIVASDITQQFVAAAQELELGQLVKDPFFTLFESVGALEIMDRKMDSGFLAPGETMEDDYDFGHALLPEEIIGIIDQLLCHEMAWHMGYPLSQTIFTSLYIDRIMEPAPQSLDHTIFDRSESAPDEEPLMMRVLRAYCVALIKTCWFVNNRVKAEHYYEEEDFVTHTYNRNLLEGFDHQAVLQFLTETSALLANDTSISSELADALLLRLKFRNSFLHTVVLSEETKSNETILLWQELQTISPKLKASAHLGKPVPASFSIKIQRRLASTIPPRPIVETSQAAAFNHLENLCKDGAVVVEVLQYHDSQSLLAFVLLFQSRKPQPSVYIRTLLQHYLFGDMVVLGKMSIRQLIDEDLATSTLPGHILLDRNNDEIEVLSDPRYNMAVKMELFRSRAAGSYLDILRTICQNRCRIRRTLCQLIVDWDNLQLDAEELDQDLRTYTKEEPIIERAFSDDPIYSFPLSSWAYHYKIRLMEWIVQMGFELETYQPSELATMYWYLQYLAKTRSRHLERIRGFSLRSREAAPSPSTPEGKQKQLEFIKAINFANFASLEAAATHAFADALSCLYTVLSRLNLLPKAPEPYRSNDLMRYEVRMKPFSSIGLPELIPFDELTTHVTQPNETTLDLLDFAAESAASAKKAFEIMRKLSPEEAFCQGSHESWLKNVNNCLKAYILTSITISTVKKAVIAMRKGSKDMGIKIEIEIPPPSKGFHDWWLIPKAVSVA